MRQHNHKDEVLKIKRQRLWELEKQAALYGKDCPPHISIEVAELRKEITDLEQPPVAQLSPDSNTQIPIGPTFLEELLSSSLSTEDAGRRPERQTEAQPSRSETSTNNTQNTSSKVSVSRKKLRAKLCVFLCHSSGDKDTVYSLYHRLRIDGFYPWLDKENLIAGQDWDLEIANEVRSAHVVIVCLSQTSVTKEGYVQKEIRIALDTADEKPEGTIYIIPLPLENCPLPTRLSKWHAVPLYEDEGYGRLVAALDARAKQLNDGGMLRPRPKPTPQPRSVQRDPVTPDRKFVGSKPTQTIPRVSHPPAPKSLSRISTPRTTTRRARSYSSKKNVATPLSLPAIRKGWRSVIKQNIVFVWISVFSLFTELYRVSGIRWFANDAFILLGVISLIVLANVYQHGGLFSKMVKIVNVVYFMAFIAVYAILFAPRGIDLVRVDNYAVNGYDELNILLLLISAVSAAFVMLKIYKI